MCGVIGLVYENHHPRLGRIAADLLRTLEYRGYDSTGAAIQGDGAEVTLAKGVGAPSVMVHELGILAMSGRVLCGQVRWATFGAVTTENSQPHVVRCHSYLYGAHNGNVTNCDDLKRWLTAEGHAVLSDNDGEMLVHTVEHFFAHELAAQPEAIRTDAAARRACMRAAIVRAAERLQGSYAAVVVDPATRCAWAIKQGSSLYFGPGGQPDEAGGRFAIASSDLSAVLRLTRTLVPLSEGEFVEYTAAGHQVYCVRNRRGVPGPGEAPRLLRAGEAVARPPVRSRLRARDTALLPGFSTYMEQEIAAQERSVAGLVALYQGGSPAARRLAPAVAALDPAARREIHEALDELRDQVDDAALRRRFHALAERPALRRLADAMGPVTGAPLMSAEAGLLGDLLPAAGGEEERRALSALDAVLELEEVAEVDAAARRFTELCQQSIDAGGRLFCVCCGSSYHAAKAAALFFNEIARAQLVPVLPGEFRGQYARSLRDGDLIIAVSQSGETKDLIDVLNHVTATGRRIARVGVVNNLNSTLAQEKSDLVIPLRCGPEIAVPATKSFLNQVAVFYCLALRLGQHLAAAHAGQDPEAQADQAIPAEATRRLAGLGALPGLIRQTLIQTEPDVERAAELLFLAPSMHLLATRLTAVALEGALKVREVVLNHTEGYEGSEFKHGPNTILGFNTIFGPQQIEALLHQVGAGSAQAAAQAARSIPGAGPEEIGRAVREWVGSVFSPASPSPPPSIDRDALFHSLAADYPLVYITGPDEQDVNLTVSQINTHKIRGASTVVVAEEHPALRQAAGKPPADNHRYRSAYIALPATGDTLLTVFSATVVLQRLALKMSLAKMAYLDRLGIKDHGVHPDVPKNVSKSITVD